MEQECHFHLNVRAPRGLAGIEQHLAACRMNLEPRVSNFNGQVLLRTALGEERFEFQMDPSQTDIIVASGNLFLPEQEAWELLLSLSEVLKQAGFPHLLGMDSPCGQRSHWTRYDWPTE